MSEKKTILVVDDSRLDRIVLRQILKQKYDVLEAESGQQALEMLETLGEQIAALVLDIVMPQMSGFEYMKIHMAATKLKKIPIIVTTADESGKTEQEALELGAWDFIPKPFSPGTTLLRICNAIEHSMAYQEERMHYQEEYDDLTGIYNKQKFFSATKNLLNENPDKKFVYIRMDIEKFQLVNTFFGMIEGDRLLRTIGQSIQREANHEPLITYGRIEADIFAMCIPFEEKEKLVEFVEITRSRFRGYQLEFDLVPTFGFYVIEDLNLEIHDMDDRANLAAKHCKGNYIRSYEFYSEEMGKKIIKEQRIVNHMRKALQEEDFIIYLQPKISLQQKKICGAEALIRWKTKQNEIIGPSEFIPIFEQNGFITELDYYVWEKTCQLLQKWIAQGKTPCPISVNISRVSTYNYHMVENICGLVKKYQIPPELLQLELTESAYTGNPVAVKEMMEQLQNAGFTILMDDFGSGYSSLNVLKDIEVDVLKIDMKFLSDSKQSQRSESILTSVVHMAKWLNIPVVAEGVERKEQALFLQDIGCEYVQGFYFAKPMPTEEYEKLLHDEEFFEENRRTEHENG